jgi:deoxyribonuclease-4
MGILGCHVSIQGGVEHAPERGYELGCEAIQIFTRNQRRWKSKPLESEQITGFKEALQNYKIQAVLTHSIYLINLASPDKALRKRSENAFLNEMDRCDKLGIPYLVFHPGSSKEKPKKQGIKQLASKLIRILSQRKTSKVILLVENTAGPGSILGSTFEELAEIYDLVNQPHRLQFCFDTAHAFAAGYKLHNKSKFDEVLDDFDSQIGLEQLKAFHLNDSAVDCGSHLDRHAHIGHGNIDKDIFRSLVNDPRFSLHPMVLETPGGDEWFRKNLELLFSFRQ